MKPLHMLQGGGEVEVWSWPYIFMRKLVMIDAFVHIFQYSQENFHSYLLSEGQCLN